MSSNKTNCQKKENKSYLKYWIAYSNVVKIGPITFKKLIDHFPNMKVAWNSSFEELKRANIEEKLANYIIDVRRSINPDEKLDKMTREGVQITIISDKDYPQRLKNITNPPPILYYRGSLDFLDNNCLAIVGTRKFSTYGRQVTEEITTGLAQTGLTIVSGLALGIDAIAHKACLNASGKTIAVLGSGINQQCVFPTTNRYIADQIIDSGGGLISEYPVGTMPAKYTFPMRNRIISGLSKGVLIVESPKNSGSLITAKHALDQNRDIYAVPGNIYSPNSNGTNNLIKQGAKPVTCLEDILEEFDVLPTTQKLKKQIKAESKEEEIILELLSKEPLHIDKLKYSSKLNINVLLSILTLMEIKGSIKDMGGKNYIKN